MFKPELTPQGATADFAAHTPSINDAPTTPGRGTVGVPGGSEILLGIPTTDVPDVTAPRKRGPTKYLGADHGHSDTPEPFGATENGTASPGGSDLGGEAGPEADRPEDAEPARGSSGVTPPPKPPEGGSDLASGDIPDEPHGGGVVPTLEPGEIIRYTLDDQGYTPMFKLHGREEVATIAERMDRIEGEGASLRPHINELDVEIVEVPSDTTVIARGTDNSPITLTAETQDGSVVTLQNPDTGESAMVNVNPSLVGTEAVAELIDSATQAAAALGALSVVAHVFGGNQDIITADGVTESAASGIAEYLRMVEGISDVTVPYDVQGEIDISMRNTDVPEARVGGILVYPPDAPPATATTSEVSPTQGEVSQPSATAEDSLEAPSEVNPESVEEASVHIDTPEGNWQYTFRTENVTDPRQAVSDITLSDERAAAAQRAIDTAKAQVEERMGQADAPVTPAERAQLLGASLPDGPEGLDALALMIQDGHPLLTRLFGGGEKAADSLPVITLLKDKVDSVGEVLDSIFDTIPDTETETQERLLKALESIGDKKAQLLRLEQLYLRMRDSEY